MSACEAGDGGMGHTADVREYVGVCVRGHVRRGWVCGRCAGPKATRCTECPAADPKVRVLIAAEAYEWAESML